jgi:predicted RNA methylase
MHVLRNPGNRLPADETVLTEEVIGPLAPVSIRHPAGTYPLTPASAVSLEAISRHPHLFAGIGIDWGCGNGCLAIVAAKLPAVRRVLGLDIAAENVRIARENAELNGVADSATFILADSFRALTSDGAALLEKLKGSVDFVVANPPASEGDDGFSYRRMILEGAGEFLRNEGSVFLQISIQYGATRIERLAGEGGSKTYRWEGAIASTAWVPFDLERDDLRQQIEDYVAAEERGEPEYRFGNPLQIGGPLISAREAFAIYRESGMSPLTQWQVHRFTVVT